MKSMTQIVAERLKEEMDTNGNLVDIEPHAPSPEYNPERLKTLSDAHSTKMLRKGFANTRGQLKSKVLSNINAFLKETDGYNDDEIDDIPDEVIDEIMEIVYE